METKSKREMFLEKVSDIIHEAVKAYGMGDIQIESDDVTDEYMMGTIYGMY